MSLCAKKYLTASEAFLLFVQVLDSDSDLDLEGEDEGSDGSSDDDLELDLEAMGGIKPPNRRSQSQFIDSDNDF